MKRAAILFAACLVPMAWADDPQEKIWLTCGSWSGTSYVAYGYADRYADGYRDRVAYGDPDGCADAGRGEDRDPAKWRGRLRWLLGHAYQCGGADF